MKYKQKAKNAIKWIENLPNYKQAPIWNRGKLGSAVDGYCCLGAGCDILDIEFREYERLSQELAETVGLQDWQGVFVKGVGSKRFYNEDSLVLVNDETHTGFLEIANLMKKHPTWIFEKEVAETITKHFA